MCRVGCCQPATPLTPLTPLTFLTPLTSLTPLTLLTIIPNFPHQIPSMKKIIAVCSFLLIACLFTQAQTTTMILLRHAEKDTSAAGSTMMAANPALSKEGEARAARLPEVLKEYTPDLFYSTDYTRTKATITPLARKFGKEIATYDPRKLADIAAELQKLTGKTIVVAGHSNTTPRLVNLLIGEKKYPDLDESVYNQYWVVTIREGKAEARQYSY
jgi:2,3-bisphosphoglycerate-dependent phosphoglycerate mutase